MKITGLTQRVALITVSAAMAGALAFACGGGGGSGDNIGGNAGGDGDGGDGGERQNGGSGGSGPAGGKGGGSGGGSGGTASGGTAGMQQGGSGGAAGGGSAGTGGMMMSMDKCAPLPTNKGGIIGPLKPWAGPLIKPVPFKTETLAGMQVWVPGQYEAAADGKVAIMFFSGVMGDQNLKTAAERLMTVGMMPPTVMAFGNCAANVPCTEGIDWGAASDSAGSNVKSRAATLGAKLTEIRAKYSKISTDPKMHGVGGQSTAGAVAFDLAWARPDLFGKVLGASASFAVFQNWLYPYPDKVDASNKDKIRFALDVGECDLVSQDSYVPASCKAICMDPSQKGCLCGGCDDANWVGFNKETVTKLTSLGYKAQLLVRAGGTHNAWTLAVADDLAFLWRDVVCP